MYRTRLVERMSEQFVSSWWSIQLEPGWFAEREPECASFWRKDGVGALQISAYKHDNGSLPGDDLAEFMENEVPENVTRQKTQLGEFLGYEVDYILEGTFWRKVWITKDSLLMFITYTSDAEDRRVESVAVDKMLASLKSRL